MHLVRKLSNTPNLYKLRQCTDVGSLDADILRQEFSTQQNNLSFWKCERIDDGKGLKDTLKAILLSASSIKISQFVIIDIDILSKFGLVLDFSEEGKTGYKGFGHLHVNLTQLTYSKIGDVLSAFRTIIHNDKLTPLLRKQEVKEFIAEAYQEDLVIEEKMNDSLLSDIRKLKIK